MKRLLIVVNDANFFLSHRLPIALAAKEAGFDVHIATTPISVAKKITDHGLTFHNVPFSRSGMRPLHELRTMLSLYGLYKRVKPRIVHHVTIKPVLYGGIIARILKVPAMVSAISGLGYIFVSESLQTKIIRFFITAIYKIALNHKNTSIIVQNPDDASWLRKAGIANANVIKIIAGSGVDLDIFSPKDEKSGLPVVLFASRLLWDKGAAEFVGAAKILTTEGLQARFVLAGDADPANPSSIPLQTLEKWRSEKIVELWGSSDDMPGVFAKSHIFCLPSYREGLSKVLIEAAACGKPIITTNVPGCRDVVEDGLNGLLVPAKDPKAIATAIKKLINNPTMRRQMGVEGRKKATQEFGVKLVVKETMHIYSDLS